MNYHQAELLNKLTDPRQCSTIEERLAVSTMVFEGCNAKEAREIAKLLVEQNHRMGDALRLAQEREEALKQGPQICGVIVERPAENRLKVSVGGAERMVGLDPDLAGASLAEGDAVLLNADLTLVVAKTERPRAATGDVAVFEKFSDDGEILVKAGGGPDLCVKPINGLKADCLERGDSVLIDRVHKYAIHKLSDNNVRLPFEMQDIDDVGEDDVGGLEAAKEKVFNMLSLCLLHREVAGRYRRGDNVRIMLTGPPGVGKTLLAKLLAARISKDNRGLVRFLSIKPSEWVTCWAGETEQAIRKTFLAISRLAAQGGFVVVYLDEVEGFCRIRGTNHGTTAYDDFTNAFLAEVDGIKSLRNVAIISSTNRPDLLDPAARSRLGQVTIRIGAPRMDAARQILGVHLAVGDPWAAPGERERTIEAIVSLLYAPNSDLARICRVKFADGTSREIRTAEIVSGRMLAQIAAGIRDRAALREIAGGAPGISHEDVSEPTETAVGGLAAVLTRQSISNYIDDLPQDLTVTAVERLLRTTNPNF